LGISTGVIDRTKIDASSEAKDFEAYKVCARAHTHAHIKQLGTTGWCSTQPMKGGVSQISIHLAEPTTIERIRVEKVGIDKSAYTNKLSLQFAERLFDPHRVYADDNGTVRARRTMHARN
jgi:hypothetical protein